MTILITGATGFIGRALVPVLHRDRHTVLVWTRSAGRAKARLGADIEPLDASSGHDGLTAGIERSDAVINLAGAAVLGGRWTTNRRRALRDSRVGLTRDLVAAMAAARSRPRVLVSASAVGYYGDRGDAVVDETAPPGGDFLAALCAEWEAAAAAAEALGARVVRLRTGVVLGRDGGMMERLLPLFRAGLGGRIGSGRQYLSWIHLHDLVAVIVAALSDSRLRGAVNAVAPNPVTSSAFAGALGRAVSRPALIVVPATALRVIFGQAAGALLDSQRVDPAVLRRGGFSFRFTTVDEALTDIVGGAPVTIRVLSGPVAGLAGTVRSPYLDKRQPRYELRTTTVLNAPVEKVFTFFSQPENLGLLTPSAMRFSISGRVPDIAENTTIAYRLRVGPVAIRWRSRIVDWRPEIRFVDQQERGPYRCWWHEHSFSSEGSSTVMEDRVCYAPPLSVVGRVANRLFIAPMLRRIFQYRADVIRLRFGDA